MLLSEAIQMFLNEKKSEGISNVTVNYYNRTLLYFKNYVGDIDIDKLNSDLVIDYKSYLLTREKIYNGYIKRIKGLLSKASVNNYLRGLRVFLNYLYSYELINKINLKLVKEPLKNIEVLTDNEVRKIINLPEKNWLDIRNKLLIYFMLDAGLRRQEVINLMISDVDIISNIIRIHCSKGDKDRNVPMSYDLKKMFLKFMKIRPLPEEQLNNVFLSNQRNIISANGIKSILERIKKKLDINQLNPHYLRHTFATKFLINQYNLLGVADIEQLRVILGHESSVTTRKYLHLANQHLFQVQQFSVLKNAKKK